MITVNILERFYVTRREGRRESASNEDCVDAAIQRLEKNLNENKDRYINYNSKKKKTKKQNKNKTITTTEKIP